MEKYIEVTAALLALVGTTVGLLNHLRIIEKDILYQLYKINSTVESLSLRCDYLESSIKERENR